ncbi:MAG: hypothetical protein IPF63_10340 [Bacteroidetes bacterium]|nr:hypothetical protein [Bacteroidota bacterium]
MVWNRSRFFYRSKPGDWIYLQVWDQNGNDFGKDFQICVSEQKSADDCVDATDMTLDKQYCWSVESHRGETPNQNIPGSGLNTCFGSSSTTTFFLF